MNRQFIYISHFLEEEIGRGRGWLHCAFSCPVSADGSCWALCCIPLAPHHCWWQGARASWTEHHSSMEPFLSLATLLLLQPVPSISSHSQSHHWPLYSQVGSCWRTSPTFSSGGAWPAASGGMQSYQASSEKAFRCFQYISPGHWQGEMKGSTATGGCSTYWMGSHRPMRCQKFPQPHSLHLNEHLQIASKSQDLALELNFKLLSAWGCSGLQIQA